MLIFIIYAILLRSDHAYIESADTTASFIKFSPPPCQSNSPLAFIICHVFFDPCPWFSTNER